MEKRLLRNSSICFLLLLAVGFSTRAVRAQDNPEVSNLVALLGQHDDALAQKNLDALMNLYADGSNTIMMGTGPGERWQGKTEIRDAYSHIIQDYDAGSQKHDCYWKTGGVNGNAAWLSAMCKVSDTVKKKQRAYELNVSAVFEKINGQWLVRQMHYSNVVSGKKPS
jgi:ketosteroid isomerase-like protein